MILGPRKRRCWFTQSGKLFIDTITNYITQVGGEVNIIIKGESGITSEISNAKQAEAGGLDTGDR